jgi:hypothetical protein
MTRGVDRGDAGQAEVPLEVGVDKGGHEGAGGAVDMHRDVEIGDHADRVLVAARHHLLGGEVEAIPSIGTRRISMSQ